MTFCNMPPMSHLAVDPLSTGQLQQAHKTGRPIWNQTSYDRQSALYNASFRAYACAPLPHLDCYRKGRAANAVRDRG